MLPAATEQLVLVAALGQGSDDPCTSRLGMSSVLLEHEGKVLPDELRTRDAALPCGTREQPVVLRIERDGGRLLPCQCHRSNMTRRMLMVKATQQ